MFLKYLVKSMLEKKLKTLLLLMSIGISAALFYITLSSNNSIMKIAEQKLNREYGSTDIIISPNSKNSSPFIDKTFNNERIKQQIPILKGYGTFENKNSIVDVDITGIKLNDLNTFVKTTILKQSTSDNFNDNKAIISKSQSELYNIKIDDEISIKFNNEIKKLKVYGITNDEGFSYTDTNKLMVLVPYTFLEKTFNIENKANLIYATINTTKIKEKNQVCEDLINTYQNYEFTQLSSEDFLDGLNSNLNKPLYIMLAVVVLMSSFIIYTSFNLIVLERMPVVGTFLSVGATRSKVNLVFLYESILLGVIGGIIGNLLGMFGSQLLLNENNNLTSYGINAKMDINFKYIVFTMILSIALPIVSAIIPVLKTNKISIKNIILNINKENKPNSNIGFFIGVILIIVAVIDKRFITTKYEAYASVFNVIVAVVAIILLLDNIIRVIGKPISSFFRDISITNFLALNNVITSKPLINNIRLISLCVTVMVIISTVSMSIIGGLNNLYSQYDSDIEVRDIMDVSKVEKYLNDDKDVKRYIEHFNSYNIEVEGKDSKIGTIEGIDSDKYKEYNNYYEYDNKIKDLDTLKENERNILLSTSLLDKYNKNVGDYITLVNKQGNKLRYKITASFNAQMAQMGSVALISENNAKNDFSFINPNKISIKLNPGEDISSYYDKLSRSEIKGLVKTIIKQEERKQKDIEENNSFIGILRGVSMLSLVIGGFGILNNMIISFIQRKKDLAVLQSIGITDGKKYIMLFLEALISGVISIFASVASITLVISNLEGVFKIMGTYMKVQFSLSEIIKCSVLAIIIILISSISTVLKAKKVSIINEIKYE